MANYFEMNRDELVAEQEKLKWQYKALLCQTLTGLC